MCVCVCARPQISEVRPFVTKALPTADSVILDAEVLLVDKSGELLKFGTLGAWPVMFRLLLLLH